MWRITKVLNHDIKLGLPEVPILSDLFRLWHLFKTLLNIPCPDIFPKSLTFHTWNCPDVLQNLPDLSRFWTFSSDKPTSISGEDYLQIVIGIHRASKYTCLGCKIHPWKSFYTLEIFSPCIVVYLHTFLAHLCVHIFVHPAEKHRKNTFLVNKT